MDETQREASRDRSPTRSELLEVRRETMDALIIHAEQAITRARAVMDQAWLVRENIRAKRSRFGPIRPRPFR
jgi:hypothetical protein